MKYAHTCNQCGKVFYTYKQEAKYCSQACYGAAQRVPRPSCVVCGAEVIPTGGRTGKYCSVSCRCADAAKYREKSCVYCLKTFVNTQNPCAKYCSHECYANHIRGVARQDPAVKVELKRKRDKRNNYVKRARRKGALTEKFDASDIFERDGWVCHICGKKINRALKWPHPKSASLDHIIPCAHGGPHLKRNVKASHLTCNLKKHTRSLNEQLMMFG